MKALYFFLLPILCTCTAVAQETPTWRYYRPGNTGIQGDFVEAIWIGPDGDPYIGGYVPSFEEGGFAKFVQAENRWINYSNVDYPVLGHPESTGITRISDIVQDPQGRLWMGTGRTVFTFDPDLGASSITNMTTAFDELARGSCHDIDIAPDSSIWFALQGWGGNTGGLVRHTPADNGWSFWTGGAAPVGGNGWPMLVWSVRHVAAQPKPGGGYAVWCSAGNGASIVVFDSDSGNFTFQEFSYTPGSILELPGKDCVDDAGNLWARRFSGFSGGDAVFTLDYRDVNGTWTSPAQPVLPAVTPPIWAFRAFGDRQALLIDGGGTVLRFDGTAWQDMGVWREGLFSDDVNIDAAGNIWACGIGGAAKRNATTGLWQRHRVTNHSYFDLFSRDLSIDPASGAVYVCANAGPGTGGMNMFDGTRWIGFNEANYGLGHPWPFPTDNSQAVLFRRSTGRVVVNPMYDGLHEWTGSGWTNLQAMDESRGMAEDSRGRLWNLGPYYALAYYDSTGSWTPVAIDGLGNRIATDKGRAGTIWASTGFQVLRTDGTYRFSRVVDDFPELNPQSDFLTTVAPDTGEIAWVGTNQGLARLDARTGTYTWYSTQNSQLPANVVSPYAVTPDGRVWFAFSQEQVSAMQGLGWFDGTSFGYYLAPADGGPQWGGLPHAQITDIEVRELPGAYELWMTCISRGIAVLTVPYTSTSVSEEAVPGALLLAQNYPNPFNPATTIAFEVPAGVGRDARVSLKVFNLVGQEVATLVDGVMPPGRHTAVFQGGGLGSGVYIYRLSVGNTSRSGRMVLVK